MPPRAEELLNISPKTEVYARSTASRRLRAIEHQSSSLSSSSSASSAALESVVVTKPSMLYRDYYQPNERTSSKSQQQQSRLRRRHRDERKASSSTNATMRVWMSRAWQLHFALSLTVLLCGVTSNRGSSKYIPIEPSQFGDDCVKAFLNVMAPDEDDVDSKVCCDPLQPESAFDICSQTKLPMSNRLKRFPEAWLLPLFPLLLRWLVSLASSSSSVTSQFRSGSSSTFMLRRLALYIGIMCVRGLILYQGMNQVEDHFFKLPADQSTCWYQSLLRADQAPCYGRIFDFSDHIVLYFAQILPIALMESFDFIKTAFVSTQQHATTSNNWEQRTRFVVGCCMLYLYCITLVSAYKTTAYFHTGPEVLAGYAVSLLVQLPLYAIQCYPLGVREWLFGDTAPNKTPKLKGSMSSSRSLKSMA